MKSVISLVPEDQHNIFVNLQYELIRIGFSKFLPQELDLERKALVLSKATRPRQVEGESCAVFRLPFMSGYFIEVLPRFNEKTKLFTEEGQATIQIKTIANHQRLFGMYFKKWDGFDSRLETMAEFLKTVLSKHPRSFNGRYMSLEKSKKNKWRYYFVDPDYTKSISKRIPLAGKRMLNLFPEKRKEVAAMFSGRDEYVDRKPENVEDISNTVHRRHPAKPHQAVPKTKK